MSIAVFVSSPGPAKLSVQEADTIQWPLIYIYIYIYTYIHTHRYIYIYIYVFMSYYIMFCVLYVASFTVQSETLHPKSLA